MTHKPQLSVAAAPKEMLKLSKRLSSSPNARSVQWLDGQAPLAVAMVHALNTRHDLQSDGVRRPEPSTPYPFLDSSDIAPLQSTLTMTLPDVPLCKNDPIACGYRNASDRMVIVRCIGPDEFFLERVVFPFELLSFECPPSSDVQIWTHGLGGAELLETLQADGLLIEPTTSPALPLPLEDFNPWARAS